MRPSERPIRKHLADDTKQADSFDSEIALTRLHIHDQMTINPTHTDTLRNVFFPGLVVQMQLSQLVVPNDMAIDGNKRLGNHNNRHTQMDADRKIDAVNTHRIGYDQGWIF